MNLCHLKVGSKTTTKQTKLNFPDSSAENVYSGGLDYPNQRILVGLWELRQQAVWLSGLHPNGTDGWETQCGSGVGGSSYIRSGLSLESSV